ncbi:MAG TPA: DUF3352 domain-containing protein [Sedimentisphaerales bacterium]|nr:DUF3352 domain-containing protein [Sedimentisphaerales bacterium]
MKNAALTNNKSLHVLMLLCSCALMLLCVPASVSAIELPKTAKLVPPETILLVDINNFNQLWEQIEKTNFYQLYKDPAMAAFIDNFKTKWQEKKQESEREFVRTIADAGILPQGRVAVALVFDEKVQDVNEPVLVVAQWGDKIDKVKELANEIVRKAVEDGARRQTEDYRGVEITTIEKKPPEALNYCFIDDCLIASTSPNVLKFVIAQVRGAGSTTLADDRDYAAAGKAVNPSNAGRIDFYVNIKQIIKTELAGDTTGRARAMIDNLGLNNVTSFGGSVEPAGGPGGSSFAKAILKIDGAKAGICKMLDVESGPLRMPRFIAGSASSISVANLNIKKAFDELANILTKFSPQMAAIMYMPILPPGPQGEPALQLKANIIDHLGSQIILAQSIDKPNPESAAARPADKQPSPATQSIIAIAIENRNALEKSLSLIHSKMIAPNNPEARRELLGHTIYSVDLSGFFPGFAPDSRAPMQAPAGSGTSKAPPAAFTVTDTHLLFANQDDIEQAIRTLVTSQAESIGSANWFNKAKSNIPSAVGLAGLQNNTVSGEYFWSTIRQSAKPDKADGDDKQNQISVGVSSGSLLPQVMFTQGGAGLFDFSLLPEFDAVKKYFGVSAFYGISRPDGFFFEFKYLNPDTP